MIERESQSVVGDIGFIGPPDEDGSVEVGYSVIPARRGRGDATQAARAIVAWGSMNRLSRSWWRPATGATHRPSVRSNESASVGQVKRTDGLGGAIRVLKPHRIDDLLSLGMGALRHSPNAAPQRAE